MRRFCNFAKVYENAFKEYTRLTLPPLKNTLKSHSTENHSAAINSAAFDSAAIHSAENLSTNQLSTNQLSTNQLSTKKPLINNNSGGKTDIVPVLDPNKFDFKTKCDLTLALGDIRKAAEGGYGKAVVQLGNIALDQKPSRGDLAVKWYLKMEKVADEADRGDAYYNLGLVYYEGMGGVEKNVVCALKYFKMAGELRDVSAMFWLGHVYRVGDDAMGVERDRDLCLKYLHGAADLGHAMAQYYVALLYRNGEFDMGPDSDRFHEYLKLAVENEEPDALFCMADLYFHGGDGIEQDYRMALKYYDMASRLDHADAKCSLGTMYYRGIGTKRNDEKAFQLYQEAGHLHHMDAWRNVARMYFLGHGVRQSEDSATSILKMVEQLEN